MTDVLLVTCAARPDGEPNAAALDAALRGRDVDARWAVWDDPAVDWSDARLVAVRSTWDYVNRHAAFVAWAHAVEGTTSLLNGAEVFAWNVDKAYLVECDGVLVVPTVTADSAAELSAALARWGTAVVKPRVGAGGTGVLVVSDPHDPRLGVETQEHPLLARAVGPWVVQPLVESVRTEGETSVFVIGGEVVAQVDKRPAGDEVRVHEHFGGRSTPVPLRDEARALATAALQEASTLVGRDLDYGRVDMMRLADGTLAVSELELVEPGLYLDVLPGNAEPFADLVVRRLEEGPRLALAGGEC